MTAAGSDLAAFGRELGDHVNPMWLLRTLPNNVLGHVAIRYGLKGANACITNHSVGGSLAVIEAAEALRNGEADRALAVGHDGPIEPQMQLYYYRVGLLSPTALREVLGGGCACEAGGLVAVDDDGDGVARAVAEALANAGLAPSAVAMIVAHGNGTRASDRSEAAALRRVFGAAMPPVTAFKWATGHLIAAAGILETTLALAALADGTVPGVATLAELDAECAGVNVAATARPVQGKVALIVCRGFAGTDAALVVRAA